MRIYIANDTSDFHAGSSAVIRSLIHTLEENGHTIVHRTKRPYACDFSLIDDCDALVVNGEGALQEEAKGWMNHRAQNLLRGLEYAMSTGKQAHLVNCVWYRMNPGWQTLLQSLDSFWVREISSRNWVQNEQGVIPQMYLDLSYTCPVDSTVSCENFGGATVVGHFYKRNMSWWDRFDDQHRSFKMLPHLSLGGTGEGVECVPSWDYVVRSLETAGVYVTGQHHGVYAACKARTPFVPFKLYNHKISGLLAWAGIEIPIATTRRQILEGIERARRERVLYEKLFDWMDKQPSWPGILDD